MSRGRSSRAGLRWVFLIAGGPAVCIVAGFMLGQRLDARLHTTPLFAAAGSLAGAAVAAGGIVRFLRQEEEASRRRASPDGSTKARPGGRKE